MLAFNDIQTLLTYTFFIFNLIYYYSGGMELLFQNRKSININVPIPEGERGLKIRNLLPFIRDEVKPDRPELFMQEDTM